MAANSSTRSRRGGEVKLTEGGLAVFRYDKNPDGTNARFVNARPGTPWFDILTGDAGWYQVDPKERADHEAAAAAAEDKQNAFADQERMQSTRFGQLSSLSGAQRGRGRPSKNEQAALAERDQALQLAAQKDAEIAALRRQLAEKDAVVGSTEDDSDGDGVEDKDA